MGIVAIEFTKEGDGVEGFDMGEFEDIDEAMVGVYFWVS